MAAADDSAPNSYSLSSAMANLDCIERVAVLYLLWKAQQRRRRRTRRYWVNKTLRRRPSFGEYHHLFQELRLDDGRFQRYFRLSSSQFEELLSRVGAQITRRDTNYRPSIPAAERLSICLRYLATGDSYRIIADSFRVGVSTVSGIVPNVVAAIWDSLVGEFMAVPTTNDWRTIAEEFQAQWNFPLCCGAVDGKHVQIKASPHSGSQIDDHFSSVLLAVVDARCRFRYIDVGGYGRKGDSRILAKSAFGQALRADTLDLPPDQHLPGAKHSRGRQPHVFVADGAFPLRRNMLRPFPEHGRDGPPPAECAFNYRLSRARQVAEDAFGILSTQWRWYRRNTEVRTEVVEQCVKATCVLHNFMMAAGEDELPALKETAASEEPLQALGRVAANNSSAEARRVREAFKEYFMAEGAVPGQPTE